MTREDIIRMAHEASPDMTWYEAINDPSQASPEELDFLEHFATLVSAAKCNELAKQIEAMPFGDTAASFAVWIREQA